MGVPEANDAEKVYPVNFLAKRDHMAVRPACTYAYSGEPRAPPPAADANGSDQQPAEDVRICRGRSQVNGEGLRSYRQTEGGREGGRERESRVWLQLTRICWRRFCTTSRALEVSQQRLLPPNAVCGLDVLLGLDGSFFLCRSEHQLEGDPRARNGANTTLKVSRAGTRSRVERPTLDTYATACPSACPLIAGHIGRRSHRSSSRPSK